MAIEDVFGIKGRGTVVTGRIERGVVNVGEKIEIIGLKDTHTTTVTGVEMFNKTAPTRARRATTSAACSAAWSKRRHRARSGPRKPPARSTPHTQVQGPGLRALEGRGRPSHAVLQRLPPAVLRPHDGRHRHPSTLPEGTEMVHARRQRRDQRRAGLSRSPIENGLRFAIREGGRTVGSGIVTEIIE